MSSIQSSVSASSDFPIAANDEPTTYRSPSVIKIWAEELLHRSGYQRPEGNVVSIASLGEEVTTVRYLSMLAREGLSKEEIMAPFIEPEPLFAKYLGHVMDKNPAIFPGYAKIIPPPGLRKDG